MSILIGISSSIVLMVYRIWATNGSILIWMGLEIIHRAHFRTSAHLIQEFRITTFKVAMIMNTMVLQIQSMPAIPTMVVRYLIDMDALISMRTVGQTTTVPGYMEIDTNKTGSSPKIPMVTV